MKKLTKKHKNEKGIATIEAVLLLSIFVIFMTYCVGTFGIIHTGILNSISARAYTFETMRNRANVSYFRDTYKSELMQTVATGLRAHGVATEKAEMNDSTWSVTERTLSMGREISSDELTRSTVDTDLKDKKKETGSASPVWIKTVYGICLNYDCGG